MAIVGYARVSTREQATDAQEAELRAAGAQRVFVDHGVSSRLEHRPAWDACVDYLREGDVLVVRARSVGRFGENSDRRDPRSGQAWGAAPVADRAVAGRRPVPAAGGGGQWDHGRVGATTGVDDSGEYTQGTGPCAS